jgi:hypothetical protein
MVHVINPTLQSEFKIGRSSEADLKVEDVSVSRVHCLLKINEKGFYLVDNLSKFGTLILAAHDSVQLELG